MRADAVSGRVVVWLGGVLLTVAAGYGWVQAQGQTPPQQGAGKPGSESGPGPAASQPGRAAPARSGDGRPVPVLAAAAQRNDVRIVVTAIGTVTANRSVQVRSRVGGQLSKVLFSEGQLVKAGDLLAEIDPRPFQAQLAQAKGQALRNAALLKNAELDLERYQALRLQDSIATQQVDAQEALVQQYRGTVLADQGLVDQAQLQLGYTRITAPMSGRIGLRQLDAGNIVAANDPTALAVINAVQPITAVFSIPEDSASGLWQRLLAARGSGQELAVEAWDRGHRNRLASGKLLTLDNQIDPATGTIKLKAEFPNGDGTLLPNQFVNVRLLVDTRRQAVTVPRVAIQRGTSGPFVYVVGADQTVAVRRVSPGPSEADQVVVEDGVKAGEMVVTNGFDRLRDGAKVALASPAERPRGNRSGEAGPAGRSDRGARPPQDLAPQAAAGRESPAVVR